MLCLGGGVCFCFFKSHHSSKNKSKKSALILEQKVERLLLKALEGCSFPGMTLVTVRVDSRTDQLSCPCTVFLCYQFDDSPRLRCLRLY